MTNAQCEAKLREAFTGGCDYIYIDSRRQDRGIQTINYGIERGWLKGEWQEGDQYTRFVARLTPEGRKHFGVDNDDGPIPRPAGPAAGRGCGDDGAAVER